MFKMGNDHSCSIFHSLGNGTVEQNHFYGTKGGTEFGTVVRKPIFLQGLNAFLMEHNVEQPWNKHPKTCSTASPPVEQNGTPTASETKDETCVKQSH